MHMMMKKWLNHVVLIGVIATTAVVAAAAGLSPSASVTTAVQGWEQWLRLEWSVETRGSGQEIDGYVYNKHGSPLYGVQVLGQGLDGAGNVVQQKIAWVPGTVPPLQRAYFRIPEMPPAERYRVSVWAFNVIQGKTIP
jgi:hypothetical protein